MSRTLTKCFESLCEICNSPKITVEPDARDKGIVNIKVRGLLKSDGQELFSTFCLPIGAIIGDGVTDNLTNMIDRLVDDIEMNAQRIAESKARLENALDGLPETQ